MLTMIWWTLTRTTDTQWWHKSKKSENLGQCDRLNKNMPRPYVKIWEWIFGRAVKAISSLGVRSPWTLTSLPFSLRLEKNCYRQNGPIDKQLIWFCLKNDSSLQNIHFLTQYIDKTVRSSSCSLALVQLDLISIRQNYNFDILAIIWHEILVDFWKFTRIWKDLRHRNTELYLFRLLDVQNNFMFPTCKNNQKGVKNQKSKHKHLSFDGLTQEDIDLSDIYLTVHSVLEQI